MYKEFNDKWEQLESLTQHVIGMKMAGWDKSKLDPKAVSKVPEDIEEKFGPEPEKRNPVDRWNSRTGKYETVESPD